ncbi:endonuclease/exonuclease/phosphatase family protein [Amycolatopsis sp. 195334CR]|uniref:endonuclease/exonuclease/phosphatase family protein n=1 Tax=Amycolatopsis sp. 195334CR TaxID=2814588 RepID=UPI001A8CBE0D|nr:endonuclease/exonuclease/phosphatase family protein [Amycolatopsis sp. 195334CR]MBN6035071.1 endonuclease/exonuclease/phosphatase family protein [Amycolatopsis sp. 195334CR]
MIAQQEAPPRKVSPGARVVTGLLVLATVPFVVLVAMRLFGIDGNAYTTAALALTPYLTAAGLLLGVLALVLRRWKTGAVVLLLVAALVSVLVPRFVAEEQPAVTGRDLRVMASNLFVGRAEAQSIVELVRANQVEVLSLLELSPAMVEDLDRAGLFTLLPHRVLHPIRGGAGSGLVSKYPLTEAQLAGPSKLRQPSARVEFGDGSGVEIVAVHPMPPVESPVDWKAELAGLPEPTADLPVRILAGDFNATFDHASFRELIDAGYADAADELGKGFRPTWPGKLFPPPVTIDHILVDDRVAVRDFQVFDVAASDHDAVYAQLTVPV